MRISTARASPGSTVRVTSPASSSRRTWVVIVGCEQWSSAARSEIRASPGPRWSTAGGPAPRAAAVAMRWVARRLSRDTTREQIAAQIRGVGRGTGRHHASNLHRFSMQINRRRAVTAARLCWQNREMTATSPAATRHRSRSLSPGRDGPSRCYGGTVRGHRAHRRRRAVRRGPVAAGHRPDGPAGLPLPVAGARRRDRRRSRHRVPDRRRRRLHDGRQLRLHRRADRHRQTPGPRHADRVVGLGRRRRGLRRRDRSARCSSSPGCAT